MHELALSGKSTPDALLLRSPITAHACYLLSFIRRRATRLPIRIAKFLEKCVNDAGNAFLIGGFIHRPGGGAVSTCHNIAFEYMMWLMILLTYRLHRMDIMYVGW